MCRERDATQSHRSPRGDLAGTQALIAGRHVTARTAADRWLDAAMVSHARWLEAQKGDRPSQERIAACAVSQQAEAEHRVAFLKTLEGLQEDVADAYDVAARNRIEGRLRQLADGHRPLSVITEDYQQ